MSVYISYLGFLDGRLGELKEGSKQASKDESKQARKGRWMEEERGREGVSEG